MGPPLARVSPRPHLVQTAKYVLVNGLQRTAAILTILATCIAHEVNPRAYLHVVTKLLVKGWLRARLRDLLPDRMLASHPELAVAGSHVLDGEAELLSLAAPLPQT